MNSPRLQRLLHNVGGLEVAMPDAPRMRRAERVADLPERLAGERQWRAAFGNRLTERLAFHVLHHQEGTAVRRRAAIERADYARMMDESQGFHLRGELIAQPWIFGGRVERHLDHDPAAVQAFVARQVNQPKSAAAQFAFDAIALFQKGRLLRLEERIAKTSGGAIGGQQRQYFPQQSLVALAGRAGVGLAVLRLLFNRGAEDGFDLVPALRSHADAAAPSSRLSQACAMRQSRFTVLVEQFSATAASSIERPA